MSVDRKLFTVKQFSQRHPAFTVAAMRNLIFLSKKRKTSQGWIAGNGLAPAIVRIGRKILIDEEKFFEWIDDHRNEAA